MFAVSSSFSLPYVNSAGPFSSKSIVLLTFLPAVFLTSLLFVSIRCSRGLIRRRGKGSCPGAGGLSGWRRWCWDGWKCRTLSPFTLTLARPSASTANACSRVSFARACSVKVGLQLKSLFQRNWDYLWGYIFISFVICQTADSIAIRDVLQRYRETVWGRWTLMEVNSMAVFSDSDRVFCEHHALNVWGKVIYFAPNFCKKIKIKWCNVLLVLHTKSQPALAQTLTAPWILWRWTAVTWTAAEDWMIQRNPPHQMRECLKWTLPSWTERRMKNPSRQLGTIYFL